MSIEGQGHFFTIYFPGFVFFVLYEAKISGERLQDHWSSGINYMTLVVRKSVLGGFQPIPTQAGLYSPRRWPEA